MPIPDRDPDTGALPPGVHLAEGWDELRERFATNARRRQLLEGFQRACASLRAAGCRRVYLDGSFVTTTEEPADFDGCWSAEGVDPGLLDPILLEFRDRRSAQKAAFGGELFVAETAAEPAGTTFLDFFQHDREGRPKGIVAIDLGGES